jgi:hypothetical protein
LWLCAWLGLAGTVRAADPGTELPPSAEATSQKVGSVLIFPFYTSSAASLTANTRFNLTNHHPTSNAFVLLYFVSNTGTVSEAAICLTPLQTASFLASDVDPGAQGYLVMVAVNQLGTPINFNYLEGDAVIKLAGGQQASLKAVAVSALTLPVFDSPVTLHFDGIAYSRLPRTLAADQLKSALDGNNTILVVSRIGGNLLAGSGTALGAVSGNLYNDAGSAFPFTANSGGPQLFNQLSNSFPSVTPTFNQIIPAGRTGWLHLAADGDFGIVGAVLNFNGNTATQARAQTGGHLLRALTLTSSASLTISIFAPPC